MRMSFVRFAALGLAVAGLFGLGARDAAAAVYPDGQSPVYLVVSQTEDFDVTSVPGIEQSPSDVGSRTIVVRIGTFIGGGGLLDTRFATNRLTSIPLPGIPFATLDNNQVTIFGGVLVQGTSQVHMFCPSPDPIAAEIQIALYDASRNGVIDELFAPVEGVPQFPTTYAIANAVAGALPPPPEGQDQISTTTVEAALFATPNRLDLRDNGTFAVVSEGELFPHDPGNKLFDFSISFDEDENFVADVCLTVGIDVKPDSSTNPINRGAKGKLPVAILSSDTFDATAFADATITIDGVEPTHVAIEDVNGDGLDDLICQFKIQDLAAAGALDDDDAQIVLEAVLEDGSCIRGVDAVSISH